MSGGSPYFILLAVGFALGILFAVRVGARRGLPRLAVIDACIAALIGGVVGARILHVAVEPLPGGPLAADLRAEVARLARDLDAPARAAADRALARPDVPAAWDFIVRMPPGAARDEAVARVEADPDGVPARLWYRARPLEALAFWKGGLAYLGGLVLATGLGVWATRRHGVPVGAMADLAAPPIAIGLVCGRLGCFIGGCCYGQVCEPRWWAVTYPPDLGPSPRYPTALLEAGWSLLLLVGLTAWLLRTPPLAAPPAEAGEGRPLPPREGHEPLADDGLAAGGGVRSPTTLRSQGATPARHGRVFLGLLALYAPGRFAIEALRADPRGGAGGLSTSQLLGLLLGVPAALLLLADALRARRLRAAPPPP